MGKILLVEDDNSLREIFEMRLQAEGFQTITAGDGEEGLAVALREKPDLIIADVMMPKLSGFDMLEQIRANPELKNTKAIMMTALGQAEDQARGQKLGVVKYLVKSQATLEDFARVIKDVMDGASAPSANNEPSQNNQGKENNMQEDNTTNNPMGDANAPANPMGGNNGQMSTADEQSTVNDQVDNAMADTATPAAPADNSAGATFAPSTPPADDSGMGAAPAGDSTMPATPPADAGEGAPATDEPEAPAA